MFDKYAINVTTGEDPATVATPGDTIRYGLRIENLTDTPLDGFCIVDELDRLNARRCSRPARLTLSRCRRARPTTAIRQAARPAPACSTSSDLSLAGLGDSVLIEFEVELTPVIANGSYVLNQSEASFAGFPLAISDDPNQNGAADPNVAGDEDPTQILYPVGACI